MQFAKYHHKWRSRSNVTRLQNAHKCNKSRGVPTFFSDTVGCNLAGNNLMAVHGP